MTPPSTPVRATFWTTTVLVGVLASLWALASPLMSVPDETAHTSRAVSVSRGQLVGEPDHLTMAADGLVGLVRNVQLPAPYGHVRVLMACYAQRSLPASCAGELPDVEGVVTRYTSVGSYQPVYYGLVGWPHHLLEPERALYAMRLVSAWLVAPIAGLAFAALRRLGGHPVLLLGGAVGLTPVVVFLAGGINPSGIEIVAALALWATTAVLCLGTRPLRKGELDLAGSGDRLVGRLQPIGPAGRRPLAAWAVSAVALAWARPLGPLLMVGIVAVTVFAVGDRSVLTVRWRDRTHRRVLAGVAVAWLGAWAWLVAFDTLSSFKGIPIPGLNAVEAAQTSLGLTVERLVQTVAVFGWVDTVAPTITTFVPWMLVAAGLGVVGVVRGSPRIRMALLLLGAGAVALPVVAEIRQAAEIGFGWQGRYTLPVLVGMPVLAAIGAIWPERAPSGPSPLPGRSSVRASVAVLVGGALLALAHVVGFAAALRRYTVGTLDTRPFWAFLSVDGWSPPGGSELLLALTAVVLALAGAALARSAWRASYAGTPQA